MQKEDVDKKLKEVLEKSKVDWDFKIAHRQECNEKILEMLKHLVEKWPEFRFWQIMCALGYETNPDRFYEESYDTMEQMMAVTEDMETKR